MAVPPGETVAEVGEPGAAVKLKSSPVPVSATVCGLPSASSVIVTTPVLVPAALGVKATLRVQFVLAAKLDLQVFV